MNYSLLSEQLFFCKMLRDVTAGFAFGTLLCTLLYTAGVLEKVREKAKVKRIFKAVAYVALAVLAMSLSIAAVCTWGRKLPVI